MTKQTFKVVQGIFHMKKINLILLLVLQISIKSISFMKIDIQVDKENWHTGW